MYSLRQISLVQGLSSCDPQASPSETQAPEPALHMDHDIASFQGFAQLKTLRICCDVTMKLWGELGTESSRDEEAALCQATNGVAPQREFASRLPGALRVP